MFNSKTIYKVLAASLVLAVMTGCGGGGGNGVDPNEMIDPGYTDPGYVDPGAVPGAGGVPGYTQPVPTPAPVDMAQLTASVTKKKNGSFLGMGKFTCTVEVTNPGMAPHSGTLTVTFKNGSKTSKTAPISKQVNLGPNETQTFDFEDKAWSTDAVEVDVTTDAPAASTASYGATTGAYGAPMATTTSGYPTTTYPTTGAGY